MLKFLFLSLWPGTQGCSSMSSRRGWYSSSPSGIADDSSGSSCLHEVNPYLFHRHSRCSPCTKGYRGSVCVGSLTCHLCWGRSSSYGRHWEVGPVSHLFRESLSTRLSRPVLESQRAVSSSCSVKLNRRSFPRPWLKGMTLSCFWCASRAALFATWNWSLQCARLGCIVWIAELGFATCHPHCLGWSWDLVLVQLEGCQAFTARLND